MKMAVLLALFVILYPYGAVSKEKYIVDDSQGSPICEPGYCQKLEKIIIDVNYSQQTDNPTIKEKYLEYVTSWLSSNRDMYPSK